LIADPRAERRAEEIRRQAERLGIKIIQKGQCFRLVGRDVDLTVACLSILRPVDLEPYRR
jgi:hypothetical protein